MNHRLLLEQYLFLRFRYDRARIMVGLLEFTMDAYQHNADGTSYYMCEVDESRIGFSTTYDVKVQCRLLPH